jgi:demethylspheroidene O-methyltransferase
MIEHHALVYRDLADPVALLKGAAGETELMRYWRYGTGPDSAPDAREAVDYSALMSGTQSFVQGDVLDAYDFGRHKVVLDVGGGDGTFLAALAARWTGPRLMLFDLPAVAELAAGRFQRAGLSARASVFPGDFRVDALPKGADAVSLVRILHDHGDDTVEALLARVHAALAPGGRVVVAEPMADAPGHPRVGDAYFGFYLMAMGKGRPRSAGRLIDMLGQAGFTKARLVHTRRPMLTSMIVAERGHS